MIKLNNVNVIHFIHFHAHFSSREGRLGNSLRAGVPNLSATTYPFGIPTDEHVPLQHFES